MIFKSDTEAARVLKLHAQVTPAFTKMRDNSKELKALVNGESFIEELIKKIENIESAKKAKARELYSRDIQDLFERLFQPIGNIYYASGGVKDYDITNKETKESFLKKIANIRDDKPLSEWVQKYAIKLMNTDPNGLIFLEYTTTPNLDIYPTYKSINAIRYYKAKGQLVDYVIFEPESDKESKKFTWRIVDDKKDRTFQQEGQIFTLIKEKSFTHPFGTVPALICSNNIELGSDIRNPSIRSVLGLAKEIARDQSFLTLYKVYKGNPIFWKYVSYCSDCSGSGSIVKDNKKATCTECSGTGKVIKKSDVTDAVELPLPEDLDSPVIAPNIAGFISPDMDVWTTYEDTLDKAEMRMYKTHWGTNYGQQQVNGQKTATEVIYDKQPLENRLNEYADYAEYCEWRLSEWILNFFDPRKKRNESKITINLGRRYTIEGYDTILQRYEDSKKAGENTVILDKIFSEYLVAKYRNNPIDLQINLVKAKVEPYLHITLNDVRTIFGNIEAQRKVLFQKFWNTVTDYNDSEAITKAFDTWFEQNKIIVEEAKPAPAAGN